MSFPPPPKMLAQAAALMEIEKKNKEAAKELLLRISLVFDKRVIPHKYK